MTAAVWLNSAYTIDDARARGDDVWDLLIDGWGDPTDPTGYGGSFPKVGERGLPTVFGVAIGPRSSVDRCYLAYSLQKEVSEALEYDFLRSVSLGSPAMFSQIGLRTPVVNGEPFNSSLVVLPDKAGLPSGGFDSNTKYRATYKDPGGVTRTLTTATFVRPLLHLMFYLRPPALFPPTQRTVYNINSNSDVSSAAPQVIAFPTYGRKRVYVSLNNGDDDMHVTINGIRYSDDGDGPVQAVPIVTSTAVLNDTVAGFTIDPAEFDYIIVNATPDTPATTNTVNYVVTARD